MKKRIDLITGFLGAGKTTFLKEYVKYLRLEKKEEICVLLNDLGAVNIDILLAKELEEYGVSFEMVSGGCDADCHRRRFKTKLIAMGMENYDRVVVEPSGIYDLDEFFDTLYEDPIDRFYEAGSVIGIVSAKLPESLSKESEYYLAEELSAAGKILITRSEEAGKEAVENVKKHIASSLEAVKCDRILEEKDFLVKEIKSLEKGDFEELIESGYRLSDHIKKRFLKEDTHKTIYKMEFNLPKDEMRQWIEERFKSGIEEGTKTLKNIDRIKGCFTDNGILYRVNAVQDRIDIAPSPNNEGQNVIIIIGEA